MWVALEDHYALLGVPRNATPAELRRAYRLLALKLHPDRAGYASTMLFQRLVEAYQVLSDPDERAAYDRQLADAESVKPGYQPGGSRRTFRRDDLMARLSGPLEVLMGRAAARRGPDGVIELLLHPAEARSGGTAALEVPVEITCPTCSGVALAGRVWCRRCEYAGSILDVVAVAVEIPPSVPDRTGYVFPIDPQGNTPPLRVRLRIS